MMGQEAAACDEFPRIEAQATEQLSKQQTQIEAQTDLLC